MKTNIKTKLLIIISAVLMVCCFGLVANAVTTSKTASADATFSTASFTMTQGASVRLVEDENGLRFMAEMPSTDYNAIKGSIVSCGMLIMPYDYVVKYGALTVDNVFGASNVYDYATFDGTSWNYSGKKARIINIAYTEMFPVDGKYVVRGSITNLQRENIERYFIARAYIFDGTTYRMADYVDDDTMNNTRSMFDVAAAAASDPNTTLSSDQIATIENEYLLVKGDVFVLSDTTSANTTDLPLSVISASYDCTGAWGARALTALDLSPYKSVKFYVKDTGNGNASGTWLEFQSGTWWGTNEVDVWNVFELDKQADNTFSLFINDNATAYQTGITNLSNITVSFADTYRITKLLTLVDPAAVTPDYSYREANFVTGDTPVVSLTDALPSVAAKAVYDCSGLWSGAGYGLVSLDLSDGFYSELKFYLKNTAKDGGYLELKSGSWSTDDAGIWYLFKLVKDSDANTYTLYINGNSVQTGIDDLSDITISFNGNYKITKWLVKLNPNYVDPYKIVLGNPVSLNATFTTDDLAFVSSQTTNVISTTYGQKYFNSLVLDNTRYTEYKFFYRTTNGSWFEIFTDNTFGTAVYQGNSAAWVEIKLVYESSSYRLYVGGAWKNLTVSSNLNEIVFRLGENSVYYFSEVFGKTAAGWTDPNATYEELNAYATNDSRTAVATDLPSTVCSEVYDCTGSWSGTGIAFADYDLSDGAYSNIKFFIKYLGANYLEMKSNNYSTNVNNVWLEYELRKDDGVNTYVLYINGTAYQYNITNLNQVTASINGAYRVSKLIGLENPQ